MSQANVENAERLFDQVNRDGQAAVSAAFVEEVFDANIVWEGIDDAPDRGPFRGRNEVLAHIRSWFETLDAFRSEPEEIIDAGEKVVIMHHSHGILKGSNAEVDMRFASVSEFRDGRIVSHKQYRHRAEALDAVGLGE
jgi:ketosteroid isomerase-like protein